MNEENQVEIMEEGSAMSDELLKAINEDWDTEIGRAAGGERG